MGDGDEPQLVKALRSAVIAAVDGGRSLRELARAAGLHADTICLFAKGERDIRLAAAGRLAAVLGLELVPVRPKGRRKGKG
jgi:hypothetical protein